MLSACKIERGQEMSRFTQCVAMKIGGVRVTDPSQTVNMIIG